MRGELKTLCARLGHQFDNPALLEEALAHRSTGARNYERLEFLGDALLNFVIAEALYLRHPNLSEGDLSRARASLVRGTTLAAVAREFELGEYLALGGGELKSGGFRRESILADVVESLIGATLLDAGFESARALVMRLLARRLDELPAADKLKDPKTRLQELLQAQQRERPAYEVIETTGEDHALEFTVRCTIAGCRPVMTARASSRRKAEQAAAALWLSEFAGAPGVTTPGPASDKCYRRRS